MRTRRDMPRFSHPPRRQRRSRRHRAQCARRAASRSGPGRRDRHRGRRRRHYRAFARGSPPHRRRRYRRGSRSASTKPLNLEMAATAEMVGIALQGAPARRLHRARAAAGAHHRRRARRRRPARRICAACRRSLAEAGIRVSLFIAAEPAQIEAAAASARR